MVDTLRRRWYCFVNGHSFKDRGMFFHCSVCGRKHD